jgi:cell wall-associated NlpC family hydrolase
VQAGDYGVVRTAGWAGTLIRWVTRSTVNHAFIYVDGQVIEGRPAGAGYASLAGYPVVEWSHLPLTDEQRAAIVARAKSHIGAPYSWVDVVAIGLADLFGWHIPATVRARLGRKDRLMCSQLVDLSYHEAGVELFDDGRIPGDVSPGDLLELIQRTPAPSEGAPA